MGTRNWELVLEYFDSQQNRKFSFPLEKGTKGLYFVPHKKGLYNPLSPFVKGGFLFIHKKGVL